ncbi:hypothetical protein [Sphingopyxis sp. RIFCSPHIGHO2_12_FULL_65_19]|uniref:hypothetical protein n=1 Tax=Sphingopyxis sp. RIFCSPHIGHO2_12_FULL_65_19 TaxID=1802172 RepID=UPI0025D2DCD5|nr:hypothetical protein [Sphingopyxis sp. RIFCSPHIGHO2_12_FULL_65_19]
MSVLEERLVPGRGKGGECPGTSAGQARALTAGVKAATVSGPAGEPARLAAIAGWSIAPTKIASAPTALSANVAAWANIVFMGQPSCFSLHRSVMRRFDDFFAEGVPIGESGGKARNFTRNSPATPI